MKCKDIERMVIASSGELRDAEQLSAIHSHVEHCSQCSGLKDDVESLRVLLQRRAEPVLPEDLDKKTYQMCKSEIHSLRKNTQGFKFRQQMQSIPMYMKIVFSSLLIVVVIWFFLFFKDFGLEGESLSLPAIIGLFLIIQNVGMLLLSPLLIRRFRSKDIQHTIYS